MNSFEKLMQKAAEQLEPRTGVCDVTMLRGIGYALMALAAAIKEKEENS